MLNDKDTEIHNDLGQHDHRRALVAIEGIFLVDDSLIEGIEQICDSIEKTAEGFVYYREIMEVVHKILWRSSAT